VNPLGTWVARETGGSIGPQLEGSTSSTLHYVLIDGNPLLVVRAFTNAKWLASEPDLASHEAAALRAVARIDFPTPRLVAVDATGEEAGVPAVIMTRLPGRVDLPREPSDRWLALLARPLSIILVTPADDFPWTYDPWVDETSLLPPVWSPKPELWKRAFATYLSALPEEPPAFLHRDYHPTNVLWDNGAVSGVVDWVNACTGPPSSDVAHCRLNLALMYGVDVADRFTSMIDPDYDRTWDLAPALSGLDEPDVYPPWNTFGLSLTAGLVRERLEEFVAGAC
jgi:aminoglycoside phosphotransferase (APT) family kinase protein